MENNNQEKSEGLNTLNFDELHEIVNKRLKLVKFKKIFKGTMIVLLIISVIFISWTITSLIISSRNRGGLLPNLGNVVEQNINKKLKITLDGAIVDGGSLVVNSNQNIQSCNLKYVWMVSSDKTKWLTIDNNESFDKFNLVINNIKLADWKNKYIMLKIFKDNELFLESNVIKVISS